MTTSSYKDVCSPAQCRTASGRWMVRPGLHFPVLAFTWYHVTSPCQRELSLSWTLAHHLLSQQRQAGLCEFKANQGCSMKSHFKWMHTCIYMYIHTKSLSSVGYLGMKWPEKLTSKIPPLLWTRLLFTCLNHCCIPITKVGRDFTQREYFFSKSHICSFLFLHSTLNRKASKKKCDYLVKNGDY